MDEVSVTMIAQYMKMQWLKSISNLGNEGIVKYRMKSKQLRWGVWSKKPLCRNYSQASIKMPLEAKGCKSSILEKNVSLTNKSFERVASPTFPNNNSRSCLVCKGQTVVMLVMALVMLVMMMVMLVIIEVVRYLRQLSARKSRTDAGEIERNGLLEVLEVVCNAWILGDIPAARATTSLKSHLQLFQLLVNVVALLLLHVRLRHIRLHRNLGKIFH